MAIDKQMCILVVDDSSSMRGIIKDILKNIGFRNVAEAEDGASAWELLLKERVDFIVSDWNMPKMTGIELLRKVRASDEFRETPFLMVSAESEQDNILEAIEAKVTNYIVKPFTPETMQQKIHKIFEE